MPKSRLPIFKKSDRSVPFSDGRQSDRFFLMFCAIALVAILKKRSPFVGAAIAFFYGGDSPTSYANDPDAFESDRFFLSLISDFKRPFVRAS
ncbi:MAG: hypothetical protein F6J93_06250 [Oscillatoria sp. SIO1A7]|nr:hypothetical protein [Oscillatoria sp. SIO1A7]